MAANPHPGVPAELRWIRPEQGGRSQPPPGPTYSTVARFDETDAQWAKNAWSLIVAFQTPLDSAWSQIVIVRFLAENGPVHLLTPSQAFSLYEGRRKVAEGKVLSSE
jgi:hypothetical protein